MNRTKRITELALMISAALILSYVESLVPAFFAVPGMKVGLANIAVIAALYLRDERAAVLVSVLRVLLAGFMFGSGMSIAYSLGGASLSLLVMLLLKRTDRFGIVAVSVCGGIAHNVGQILVAMAMLQTASLAWYLLILWFSGLASGAVIGVCGGLLVSRLERYR